MYLIAGLGNPTRQYEHTRHNVGFDVIDALAEKYHISINEKKHKALLGKGIITVRRSYSQNQADLYEFKW